MRVRLIVIHDRGHRSELSTTTPPIVRHRESTGSPPNARAAPDADAS